MNPNKLIRDIMTTDLVTVRPDAKINYVKGIFQQYGFHHLPVIKNGQELAGIISKEDFLKVYYMLSKKKNATSLAEKDYENLNAFDMMTPFPISLDPDDTIGLAADIFLANKFHALPVVEDGALMGIVTTHDLLAYSFNSAIEPSQTEEYKG